MLREIPPTAGFHLYAKEALAILRKAPPGSLESDFREYLGTAYAQVTCSGTAAFYIILETVKGLSAKKTVVIPSFICPLLPIAIRRAGLKTLPCDTEKDGFDFEPERLKELCSGNGDILAIVSANIGGLPADPQRVRNAAGGKDLFTIEDCAQSLGATRQGEKTGSSADFAFFSLCRGKGLTIYEGGVITGRREFSGLTAESARRLLKDDFFAEWLKIIELAGYWAFYRPALFWYIFRLPQIFWEARGNPERAFIEYFPQDFPLHKVSERRKSVGHSEFPRLDKEIAAQREKAAYYIDRLSALAGVKIIREAAGDRSNYPFLTLLFDEPSKRDKALKIFKGSGLGVSTIYLSAVTGYSYLQDIYSPRACPNASSLARRHITLSTSSFLSKEEIDSVIAALKKI